MKITKGHLDKDNNYIGPDLSEVSCNIYSDPNLGTIKFKSLVVKFGIYLSTGSGIEAGEGIKAGWGIKAGSGIEAGWGIKAGEGIKVGWGIEAGFSIKSKWISSKLRIFAGLCIWRKPTKEESQIQVEEFRGGEVCFGELVIIKPAPVINPIEYIEISGVRFDKGEVEKRLSGLKPVFVEV